MADESGIESMWPESRITTDAGPVFTREISAPIQVGSTDLRDLQHSRLGQPWLPRWWQAGTVDLRRCLFLDTETTGLHGGTGTYAFLVGAGYVVGDRLIVRQYFLRDLHEERAMLAALNDLWRRHDFTVTFNGRSFDAPLLQTRYVMHKTRCGLPSDEHLDLLGPARRLWKSRLPSCALTAIERDVFGIFRKDDVQGALIPTLYFNYLRRRDARALLPVFDHNVRDIASLAALAIYLAGLASSPSHPDRPHEQSRSLHPLDALSLARIYRRSGMADMALWHVQRAIDGQLPSHTVEGAYLEMAALYKRMGRFTEAAQVWETVAKHPSPAGFTAGIELAKYWEHQAKTYDAASRLTDRMLDQLGSAASPIPLKASLEHRLRRLQWKSGTAQPVATMGYSIGDTVR